MREGIHPELHPVIFVDTSCGEGFATLSTLTSEETRDVDGVSHYVIPITISSASHPFFTGKQKLIDTAGRVERFRQRYAKQDKSKATEPKKDS